MTDPRDSLSADESRRQFLKTGTAAGLALAVGGGLAMAQGEPSTSASNTSEKMNNVGRKLYPGAIDGEGEYVLPPLPYDYNALEPRIDELTMRLHHDKHHQGYVEGLIKAEKDLAAARQKGDFALIEHYLRKVSFHGGGHFLHCLYWVCMTPRATQPSADLQRAIERDFGSRKAFDELFLNAAKSVEGNGWGLLCWSVPTNRLMVMQTQNHHLLTQWANLPLLVADAWEHAYYKKYSNDRGAHLKAFMEIINWEDVSARYDFVRQALG